MFHVSPDRLLVSLRPNPCMFIPFFYLTKKQQKHTALADVHESIEELAHYREHLLKV